MNPWSTPHPKSSPVAATGLRQSGAVSSRQEGERLEARRIWREKQTISPHMWVLISLVGDLVLVIAAGFLAYWLRFHSAIRDIGNMDAMTMHQYLGHIGLGSVSLIAVLGWKGVYQRTSLLRNRWVFSRIIKSCLLWTAGFLAVTLVLKFQPPISRIYMALYGLTATLLLVGWRSEFHRFLRSPSRVAAFQQRTLFVGWNAETERLWNRLKGDRVAAFDLVGWVDTDSAESEYPKKEVGVPCVGHLAHIERIIHRLGVDMIISADLHGPSERMVDLANLCEREMIQFKVMPSCFRIFVSGLSLETVSGTPVLGVHQLPLDSTVNVMLKRMLDIVGSAVGLMLAVPIVAAFGAAVYLESPGAIFYRQRRWGINGVPFEIIKIRSMKLNAEADTGAKWCVADDPRRLRIGAFMRKWNIDELPQFWNVLKGEMSLVGPRPERPELIAQFKHVIPHYNARHHAKPGMTGWAQVKGLRGDTDLAERIKCDLWYLENWSLLLDVQIMALTFFNRDNAY